MREGPPTFEEWKEEWLVAKDLDLESGFGAYLEMLKFDRGKCPWCGSRNIYADFVDVGVGGEGIQVTPYECQVCHAIQIKNEVWPEELIRCHSSMGYWLADRKTFEEYLAKHGTIEVIIQEY
jgi:hypothetical protein